METTSHNLQNFEADNVRGSLMLLEGNLCKIQKFWDYLLERITRHTG